MDCRKEVNMHECTCTYPCERRGLCCECVQYHRSRNEIPGCFFPLNAEKTYDRSIRKYIESVK